jgi:hypothetical protein
VTPCWGCGWPHYGNRLAALESAIGRNPAAVKDLADHVLSALHHWNRGRNETIAAEWQRRRDGYTRPTRWFK